MDVGFGMNGLGGAPTTYFLTIFGLGVALLTAEFDMSGNCGAQKVGTAYWPWVVPIKFVSACWYWDVPPM
jgi:hypothetical protein